MGDRVQPWVPPLGEGGKLHLLILQILFLLFPPCVRKGGPAQLIQIFSLLPPALFFDAWVCVGALWPGLCL